MVHSFTIQQIIDDILFCSMLPRGMFEKEQILLPSYTGKHCYNRGILYGNVPHVRCIYERCPRCHKKLIGCGHTLGGVRYFKGPTDKTGRCHRGQFWKEFIIEVKRKR